MRVRGKGRGRGRGRDSTAVTAELTWSRLTLTVATVVGVHRCVRLPWAEA